MDRKALWTIAGGVAGYLVLRRVAFYIAYQFLQLPQFPLNTLVPQNESGVYEVSWAVSEAIFGVLLGLLLGLIFGYQRKNIPQPEGV
jgi:membrane associated rhomboid family serine protease